MQKINSECYFWQPSHCKKNTWFGSISSTSQKKKSELLIQVNYSNLIHVHEKLALQKGWFLVTFYCFLLRMGPFHPKTLPVMIKTICNNFLCFYVDIRINPIFYNHRAMQWILCIWKKQLAKSPFGSLKSEKKNYLTFSNLHTSYFKTDLNAVHVLLAKLHKLPPNFKKCHIRMCNTNNKVNVLLYKIWAMLWDMSEIRRLAKSTETLWFDNQSIW